MSKIKYMLKRICGLNYRCMLEKVKEIHKKSGKCSLFIFFDMIVCGFKYQAGYMDYALFEMYNLNRAQRKTVVTRGINNNFIKRFNSPEYMCIFEDKRLFSERFADFLHRDWLDVEGASTQELEEFIAKHQTFIAKPSMGMCGKGIEKIDCSNYSSILEIKEYLKSNNLFIIEELVYQHPVMARLHPHCVNTCRVITLFKDNRTHIVAAYLRIGNGKHVDNFNSGGMVVPVEEDRGEVIYPAIDKQGELYDVHPITNVPIKSFQVPMWDEVCALVKKAGAVVPQIGLVGWDVAITENGPLLIEGNDFPGHDIYGLPPHRTNGIGVLPKFEKILNS